MGVKKKPCDMGKTPFKEDLWTAQRWCIREGIYIAPRAKNDTAWYVVITNKGKVNATPDTFGNFNLTQKEIEKQLYER
jgi:hypothetical protein